MFAATREGRSPASRAPRGASPSTIELDVLPPPSDASERQPDRSLAVAPAGARPARAAVAAERATAEVPGQAEASIVESHTEGAGQPAEPAAAAASSAAPRLGLAELGVAGPVAVTSHLELASGRPGLEIRTFGIALKKGAGDRSTRLELFDRCVRRCHSCWTGIRSILLRALGAWSARTS